MTDHDHDKNKSRWYDNCDPGCDLPSCDCDPGCDCNPFLIGVFRLSSLLAAIAAIAPRRTPPVDRVGLAAIATYKRWLSPKLNTDCHFTPTCSGYGSAAIDRYGLRAGLRMTAGRLRRCSRAVPRETSDPVPESRAKR